MKNKPQILEGLVEEVAKAIYQKVSSVGIDCADAARAALSVIAPYYEKQIVPLETLLQDIAAKVSLTEDEFWDDIYSKLYDAGYIRKARPIISVEELLIKERDDHASQILRAHDILKEQKKQIEELKAQTPMWLPIEKKPETDGDYLVFMPSRELDKFSVQSWSYEEFSFSNDYGITHFMPLPKPPTE